MPPSHLNRCAQEVLRQLERNHHTQRAAELRALLGRPGDPVSLLAIEDLCHIKCLGDLDTGSLSIEKWWGMLDRLRIAAARLREQSGKGV